MRSGTITDLVECGIKCGRQKVHIRHIEQCHVIVVQMKLLALGLSLGVWIQRMDISGTATTRLTIALLLKYTIHIDHQSSPIKSNNTQSIC